MTLSGLTHERSFLFDPLSYFLGGLVYTFSPLLGVQPASAPGLHLCLHHLRERSQIQGHHSLSGLRQRPKWQATNA